MAFRKAAGAGAVAALLGWACVAPAQSRPSPDLAHGAQIAQGCLSCHGGEVTMGQPAYHIPLLYGQNAAYLAGALHAYAGGQRDNATMAEQAQALDSKDVADVSAWFAGTRVKPPPPNSSGAIPSQVVEACSACHGETGLATLPEVAVLSGQHADYLEHALAAYASGERRNPVMPVFARALSPADRAAVTAYFARLGVLKTGR